MPHGQTHDPKLNLILNALCGEELSRLLVDIEPVELSRREAETDLPNLESYVFFPTTCIISLSATTSDGQATELAMVGNEGVAGSMLANSLASIPYHFTATRPGAAFRLPLEVFRWEMKQGGRLHQLVDTFNQTLLNQIAQTALCNQHHSVKQKLSRWLLSTLDRSQGMQISMTHAQLGERLGVRREAVSEVAVELQRSGAISYSRGEISVLDLLQLEREACECYGVIKTEKQHLPSLLAASQASPAARFSAPTLRQRALALYSQHPDPVPKGASDMGRTLHELQVHQIELEMQYSELNKSYDEADRLRQRFADIYDFAPVAYVTLDIVGVIKQINLAGAILLGIKRSQSARQRFATALSAGNLNTFNAFFQEVLNGQTKRSCKLELAANAQRDAAIVLIDAVPDEDGQECRMVLHDITQREKIENELREQKEFYHLIAENISDFIAVLDLDGRRLYNSPSYMRFFGPQRDLRGTDSFAEIHPDDRERVRNIFRQTVHSGIGRQLDYRLILADGSCRDMESNGSVIRDGQGQVVRVVVVSHDVTERKQAELQVRQLAFYDPLTRLPNRRLLLDRLSQSMLSSARSRCYGALMFIDLDNFKLLNDTHGHVVGDVLLIEAADRLKACVREVDTVARFGGDEFVVVISEMDTDKSKAGEEVLQVAEKIRASLSAPYRLLICHAGKPDQVVEHRCTATIGMVLYLNHDASQEQILEWADCAMYQAKDAGRNAVRMFVEG